MNDRAITRCMGFAGQWGYGGFLMLSLFAYKSTDPCGLYAALDPIGPMNDRYLEAAAGQAGIIIAAIVGQVEMTEITLESTSPWFAGPYGLVFRHPVQLPRPIPYRGQLGIFEVPGVLKNAA